MPNQATYRTARAACNSLIGVLAAGLALGATGCASTPVAAETATTVETGMTESATPASGLADAAGVPATGNANPAEDGPAGDMASMAGGDGGSAATAPATSVAGDASMQATGGQAQERTRAEADFDAIYGQAQTYDPVADPNLPMPAQIGGAYDPWERYNRRMHRFNNAVDRTVARPLARFYVSVVPRPIRLGVGNFFNNLGQPVSAVNALLQGKPTQAGQSLGRFALNTTLGIGGIFDPASDAGLGNRSEDFGQTLGTWGWARSRYVELPLFGPRTVRDVFGMVGDAPLSPLRQVEEDATRIPLQGLQLVDVRTQLLSTDSLREGAADDYALVRDAWMQRRDYQIFGDRMGGEDDDQGLPDYLRDDNNPLVPAGAMPVMPTDH